MCGICGAVRLRAGSTVVSLDELRRTRDAMARRGPDGLGEWIDDEAGIALGHRRLAILDLSDAGAQPMASADGRLRIVFNGEIYNFRELRAELERDGVAFRTASDTEVILALWERQGSAALGRLRGMFALAIWDRRERRLTLARDPFGIKPLYYAERDGVLRFASQVRALEAGGAVSRGVDAAALVGFLLWGSVPEPRTIRPGVRAVPAGHLVEFGERGAGDPQPLAKPDSESDDTESDEAAEAAVAASVRQHLVSDVPVATFLSAGIDSTMIAAVAARELGEALTTFTLTFEGWEGTARDEAPLARRVATAIGARHVERRLGRADLRAAWPAVLAAMDQPSIDGFNSFLVARAAHEAGIRVALSGLGGDELLGSYPSFGDVPRWQRRARRIAALPAASRVWPAAARVLAPQRPKLAGLLRYGGSLAGAYYLRRGLFLPEELPALVGAEVAEEGLRAYDPIADAERTLATASPGAREAGDRSAWAAVQRLETGLYMRHQLLRDTDWAAMASSVEVRVPLVDPPLWRAVARGGGEPARSHGKAALALRVAPELPAELWSRPKSGFGVPVAEWMLPVADGEVDSAGLGSRRLALRLVEELGLCAAR